MGLVGSAHVTFEDSTKSGEPAFKKNSLQYDDTSADFTDDTSVDRRTAAENSVRGWRELSTVVESVVSVDLGEAWIGQLRRRAARDVPMKWCDVSTFVEHAKGTEAMAVRTGLTAQAIVVIDSMSPVRSIDLHNESAGKFGLSALSVLLPTKQEKRNILDPNLVNYQQRLRDFVFDSILDSSGVGLLCEHVSIASTREWPGTPQRRAVSARALRDSFENGLKGSMRKAAKLASKATALLAPILDPDRKEADRLKAVPSLGGRWGDADSQYSQAALETIAARRMVVDRGHSDIVGLTSNLRELAEIAALGEYAADRERAYEARLKLAQTSQTNEMGYVRTADDAEEVRLQIADVAAGWARTIIGQSGYMRLVTTFRCVIYNGKPMTIEEAINVDKQIADHRRLVTRMTTIAAGF